MSYRKSRLHKETEKQVDGENRLQCSAKGIQEHEISDSGFDLFISLVDVYSRILNFKFDLKEEGDVMLGTNWPQNLTFKANISLQDNVLPQIQAVVREHPNSTCLCETRSVLL